MPAVRAGIASLLAVFMLAGCGGGGDHQDGQPAARDQSAEADRQAPDRGGEIEGEGGGEAGVPSVPASDRLAFVEIGAAVGELKTGASVLAVTSVVRRRDVLALRRIRPNVKAVHPRDPRLRRLRSQVLTVLDEAIRARRDAASARRAAPATLASATRILQGLRRYASSNPAIGAVAPD
jgi:hypothetical protein